MACMRGLSACMSIPFDAKYALQTWLAGRHAMLFQLCPFWKELNNVKVEATIIYMYIIGTIPYS